MESYVEVSFLHNAMTILLCVLLGEYAALQPVSLRRCILYAILVSAIATLTWSAYSLLWMVLLELISFFFFFRYAYKSYLCSLVFRYLFYGSAFLFYGGGFHNGVWFVPMGTSFLFLWAIYALLYALLFVKWKDIFAKLSYVYDAKFFMNQTKMGLKSYLDSGNLLTYKGMPVIFVDKKYQAYFKNERIELIVMNSVTSTEVMRCYECEIQMAGCKKHKVYINAERHLKLPFKCVVLLNMKLMTMG
ncbi:sigma-E processing peptidase SpoIIGA [Amedibacillus sp. YH-ame6]